MNLNSRGGWKLIGDSNEIFSSSFQPKTAQRPYNHTSSIFKSTVVLNYSPLQTCSYDIPQRSAQKTGHNAHKYWLRKRGRIISFPASHRICDYFRTAGGPALISLQSRTLFFRCEEYILLLKCKIPLCIRSDNHGIRCVVVLAGRRPRR
jgi:hypothetical protein